MDREVQLSVPAFELDCRDWFVSTPEEESIPDSEPVLAVLSTAVIGAQEMTTATAVLSLGLLDGSESVMASDAPAELLELDDEHGYVSYVVPAPDGQIALLAELQVPESCVGDQGEIVDRFHQLMRSFSWAA